MKKDILVLLALLLASCSPQLFTMNIDMRHPSSSGIDFAGKTISVVYLDDLSGRDSVFSPSVAEGFAQAMEKDYFGGARAVEMYRMEKDFGGNYAAKDTLVNLIMDSGDDVVFLFDAPEYGQTACGDRKVISGVPKDSSNVMTVKVPYTMNLYVYDSMGKDTVQVFKSSGEIGHKMVCSPDQSDEDVAWKVWPELRSSGTRIGTRCSKDFVSTWKTEQYGFYYYENPTAWITAAQAAYDYRWHEAIKTWMTLLDTKNMEKRSYAEYNIATACYLMGDYTLAEKWLDRSAKDYSHSLISVLRKRINSRKK